MPPSNTMGMLRGKAPRYRMAGHSRKGILSSRGILRLVAMVCTTIIMRIAISAPGTTPPRNKAPTEAPDTNA